ncbi:MAG TPA: 6,7-dimethyl-8-ribityllumazine synthase, partial [Phnomibacter sp.]|nr:6,7-dimethyl-8-ribityllumazine synthase [Phnomibacter sp.]
MASKGKMGSGGKASQTSVKGTMVLIVKTAWNAHITDALADGCTRELKKLGIECKEIMVPGAVEIPFAIKHFWENMVPRPDAFIAL